MLADQKIRDEIICFDGQTFVLAGAGTGKSTIIADKIIWLLTNKKINSIKNISAITYTNKAAAELKWKIEDKLNAKLQNPDSGIQLGNFQKALSSLNESSIGTIHSFCAKIIRAYGYYEKIDPLFTIISQDESDYFLKETFLKYIVENVESKINPAVASVWKSIVKYGKHSNLDDLLDILGKVIEKTHHLEFIETENFPIQNEEDLLIFQKNIFDEYIDGFKEYTHFYDYEEEALEKENSLGTKIKNLVDLLQVDTDLYKRIEYFYEDIQPGAPRGLAKFLKNDADKNINAVIKTYLKIISEYKTSKNFSIKDDLKKYFTSQIFPGHCGMSAASLEAEYLRYLWFHAVSDFHEYFLEFKKSQSCLSYNDIILITHRLLKNETILSQLKNKYPYIFVDEYQDTDPLQTDIFTKLASGLSGQTGLFDISTATKLMRVGDAKQSIYSFRGADLETFYKEQKNFNNQALGFSGSLIVNMRSHPQVIGFINRIFSKDENIASSMDIPEYENLLSGANPCKMADAGVYISSFLEAKNKGGNEKKITTKFLRKLEAVWLASEITKVKDTGKDISICVLFLSMKDNLEPYVTEFNRKNISFQLLGRRYYGENLTKKYLMLFLNVLYNDKDKLSLAGFLRSPVGGYNDQEVHKILASTLADNFLNTDKLNKEIFSETLAYRISKTITLFQTSLELAQNNSLSSMLWFILENSGFIAFTNMLSNSEIIKESIDRFIDMAVVTDSLVFPSFKKKLRYFMDEINTLENIPDVDEPAETYNNNSVVQVMSYHKCKGLEFDVIFMPDLTYAKKEHKSNIYLESLPDQSGIIFQYENDLSFHDTLKENAATIQKNKNAFELIRLVYVAMTRAKERLYLPLYMPARKGNSIYEILMETLNLKFNLQANLNQALEDWKLIQYTHTNSSEVSAVGESENLTYYLQKYDPFIQTDEQDAVQETYQDSKPIKNFHKIISNDHVNSYKFVSGTSILKKLKPLPDFQSITKASEESLISGKSDDDDDVAEPSYPLDDAIKRGIIAHSVFEWVDLYNPHVTENVLNALYFHHATDSKTKSAIQKYAEELMETYQKSKLFELVKNSKIVGKEIPFSQLPEIHNSQKQIIVGYIDLVLKDDKDIIHVIDYKTNKKPDRLSMQEFMTHLLDTYEIPMNIYGNTLKDVFPENAIQLKLYHTATGEVIEFSKTKSTLQIEDYLV